MTVPGTDSPCILCGRQYTRKNRIQGRSSLDVQCPNCGPYEITTDAYDELPRRLTAGEDRRYLLSGYIRERYEEGVRPEEIRLTNYEGLLASPSIPSSVLEKLDKVLAFLYRKTKTLFQSIEFDGDAPAIAYAKDNDEFNMILLALQRQGLIDYHGNPDPHDPYGRPINTMLHGNLTLLGLEKASKQIQEVNTKQCFIALWFDPQVKDVYDTIIRQALLSIGFRPVIVSDVQHNDNICDQIIAEIRKSRFVIADFTGQRGGVYFEAGFALGMGIPVIWACKRSEIGNLHFDVNHYNFIDWETPDELGEKLKQRILATIATRDELVAIANP